MTGRLDCFSRRDAYGTAGGRDRTVGANHIRPKNGIMHPMNPSQPISPRRRLQELLAIPDSQRTEAQWDELNELEIKLAPGNREAPGEVGASRDGREGREGREGQPMPQQNR